MPSLNKTLKLSLDGEEFACQLDQAELTDNPETEEITTFCGTETSSDPNYELTLGGWTDWDDVNGVCNILHKSYAAAPTNADKFPTPIDFVLQVGSATRTGQCRPIQDVPFGSTSAGSAFKFTVTLDVLGIPVDGTAADQPVAKAEAKVA